ncbi:MAG TPA: hypothetical protein DCQ32_06850 [Cyanobacteria bacterium UBA8156]|nr:hypothetical protein [Cyanobacteria bacterium UBA8156]
MDLTANPIPPLPLDILQSQQLASQLPGNPKLSVFERAWRTVAQWPATDAVYYVQGFLTGARPQPQEHAWVELSDRRLDPSLPPGNPQKFGYFTCRRFTVAQVKAAIAEAQEDYPEDEALPIYDPAPYAYYGDLFLGGVAYQQAWDAAIAHQR